MSSSEGMTQREISRELSASGRTVRLWISKLRKSGKLVLEWGDDLRVPLYSVAAARRVSKGAV